MLGEKYNMLLTPNQIDRKELPHDRFDQAVAVQQFRHVADGLTKAKINQTQTALSRSMNFNSRIMELTSERKPIPNQSKRRTKVPKP